MEFFLEIVNQKGFNIAGMVKNIHNFSGFGGFCLGVEFHWVSLLTTELLCLVFYNF